MGGGRLKPHLGSFTAPPCVPRIPIDHASAPGRIARPGRFRRRNRGFPDQRPGTSLADGRRRFGLFFFVPRDRSDPFRIPSSHRFIDTLFPGAGKADAPDGRLVGTEKPQDLFIFRWQNAFPRFDKEKGTTCAASYGSRREVVHRRGCFSSLKDHRLPRIR